MFTNLVTTDGHSAPNFTSEFPLYPLTSLVLTGLTTRLGTVRMTAAGLSLTYSNGSDDPTAMTGITQLFRFEPEEDLVEIAAATVWKALANEGLALSDVGGIVAPSNFTHRDLVPTFAPAVGAALGLSHVRSGTVGIGCGGLAQTLQYAVGLMTSPYSRWPEGKVCVVVAGDQYSRHVDPRDRKTRYLFSDGVAVIILVPKVRAERGEIVVTHVDHEALIERAPLAALSLGNANLGAPPFFQMDTGPVVRFTRSILARARNLLELPTWDGITLIPHQANYRLLAAMRKEAEGVTWFHDNGIATIGNTLNASTLFELDAAIHRAEIGRDIVLLPFGAEWTFGVIRLKVVM